ncbi:phosphotransferase [Tenggerimyces flavus]|uniref:Phosphotransferase n=1 Tax=Tenggerimyces flavus TaxID=1708749 RepID=A0ABV7Y6I5_9ACTN|nr:phosphotransferase [Tenggerimyces flavus]MBM7791142.1 thiamine kinase-like enzyme [Tenggerimyces flavus]
MTDNALVGGMNPNRGVIRVGDTVRRPGMRSPVRALLRHLEAVGFDGAPRYLGEDEDGRDVVSWVDGDVPVPPYPAWALTDEALEALGHLVRDYHEAVATFDATGLEGWSTEWCDPHGGPIVCHNDLFPENVVFRDGVPVALIDFDEAGPGRPLWDLAIAAEEWAPLHAPGARLATPDALDAAHRLGVLTAAYGLAPDRADELLDLVTEMKEQTTTNIKAQAAAGDPVWSQHLAETDFDARVEADAKWLTDLRTTFAAAIASQNK